MTTAMQTAATAQDRQLHNRALLGVALMLLGLALYPLSDACIKCLMETYSVPQVTFLRSLTRALPLFMSTFLYGGPAVVLATQQKRQHAIRLLVSLAYTLTFMYAVSHGSLTIVYTVGYASPFFMILLSRFKLKERVAADRWIAVVVGLVGVAVAMRPSAEVFHWIALLVLFGTFLGALNKVLMRRLAMTEHSLAIALYPNLVMLVVLAPFAYSAWSPMPWRHWAMFVGVGWLTATGQYCIAQALRFAEASTLAPIDYSSFFWVVSLDYVWWNRTPGHSVLAGAAIIVGSNLFILYRTRREQAKALVR